MSESLPLVHLNRSILGNRYNMRLVRIMAFTVLALLNLLVFAVCLLDHGFQTHTQSNFCLSSSFPLSARMMVSSSSTLAVVAVTCPVTREKQSRALTSS